MNKTPTKPREPITDKIYAQRAEEKPNAFKRLTGCLVLTALSLFLFFLSCFD